MTQPRPKADIEINLFLQSLMTALEKSGHFATHFVAIPFLNNSPIFDACDLVLSKPSFGHARRIYIEALLVDEELADQVWEAWDKGEILTPMIEFDLTHFWPK